MAVQMTEYGIVSLWQMAFPLPHFYDFPKPHTVSVIFHQKAKFPLNNPTSYQPL